MGQIVNWNIFKLEPYDKSVPNASKWILHLGTIKNVSKSFLLELAELIKEKSPSNKINWSDTFRALDIYKEYMEQIEPLHNDNEGMVLKGMGNRVIEKRKIIDGLIAKHGL